MGHTGVGLFSWLFWVRAILAMIYVGVPALVVGATVWWATHRARRGGLGVQARRARRTRLAGIGVGAVVGVIAFFAAYGQLAPVAVAVGFLFGVLVGELGRVPRARGPIRVAELRVGAAADYVPRWAAPVALIAALVTVVAPVVFAVAPTVRYPPWSPDGAPFRLPGGTLPWPTPAMSVPLAVVAALALVTGGILSRRAALVPPAADRPHLDEVVRRNAGRAVAAAVVGIELLVLAAMTISASAGFAVPESSGPATYLVSRVLVWAGLALAAAAIVIWCVMGWWRNAPAESSPAAPPHPMAT